MRHIQIFSDIYSQAANDLNVEIAAIKAVAKVESKGDPFLPSGHPVVLFESHHFRKFTNKQYDTSFPKLSHPYKGNDGKVIRYYIGGEREVTERLEKAAGLNKEAAYKSASWGKFQIMGFNYKQSGFQSVFSFVEAMKKNENEQVIAFCNFIKSDSVIHKTLKQKDWSAFAKRYNGPDYAVNKYDLKMAKAYNQFKQI